MIVTRNLLRKWHACREGLKWYASTGAQSIDAVQLIKRLCEKEGHYSWAWWLFVHCLSDKQKKDVAFHSASAMLESSVEALLGKTGAKDLILLCQLMDDLYYCRKFGSVKAGCRRRMTEIRRRPVSYLTSCRKLLLSTVAGSAFIVAVKILKMKGGSSEAAYSSFLELAKLGDRFERLLEDVKGFHGRNKFSVIWERKAVMDNLWMLENRKKMKESEYEHIFGDSMRAARRAAILDLRTCCWR